MGAVLRRNPDLLNKPSDGHNRTLLWEAAHAGRVDMVRWLVSEGADVDIPGRYRSETFVLVKPYTVAVLRKRTEIAEFLLDSGTVVDVYTAAFLGDDDRVMAAVGDDPVIVNADQPEETVWRVTPLHHALAGGHASVVCTLLRHGVAVADHAALAFDIACRPARTDLVDLLLDAGSEPMAADVFSVVYAGDDGLAATFFGRGLDPDKPTAGWPPIVYVCRGDKGEHPDRVRILLRHGADVSASGPRSVTALHAAAKAGFATVIPLLLDAGADPYARTDAGATPLELAIKHKRRAAEAVLRRAIKGS